mgnify:CR=1 FL=1
MRFTIILLLLVSSSVRGEIYRGSQFSKVWKAIKSDRYKGDLPHKKVRALDFGFLARHIIKDSKRVVTDKSDFKKDFKKRIHPFFLLINFFIFPWLKIIPLNIFNNIL